MAINSQILTILLHWGEEPEPPITKAQQEEVHGYTSKAHSAGRAVWKRYAESGSQERTAQLIRGMVRAEEAYMWWGGSVTLVNVLFEVYEERWPLDAKGMAEWIMVHSSNDYAPFGHRRNMVTSLSGYEAFRAGKRFGIALHEAQQEQARELAQERTQQKALANEKRMAEGRKARAKRAERLTHIEQLPLPDRISAMLEDTEHSLPFYPLMFIASHEQDVCALDTSLLQRLAQRIATDSNREWMRWAKRVLKPGVMMRAAGLECMEKDHSAKWEELDKGMLDVLMQWGQRSPNDLSDRDFEVLNTSPWSSFRRNTSPWGYWALDHDKEEVEMLIRGLLRVEGCRSFQILSSFRNIEIVMAVHLTRWPDTEDRMIEIIRDYHAEMGMSELDAIHMVGRYMKEIKFGVSPALDFLMQVHGIMDHPDRRTRVHHLFGHLQDVHGMQKNW
jgi:hypothetical protein